MMGALNAGDAYRATFFNKPAYGPHTQQSTTPNNTLAIR